MWSSRAFLVSVLVAAALAAPMYYYWEFLTKGSNAPAATIMLNEMEHRGVPNFSLEDVSGNNRSLDEFKGKVIVLNFWASWCAPCVKEFPSLKRLADKFKGKLVVVAVSHDNSRDDLDSFMQSFGGGSDNFIVMWDKDKAVGKKFGVRVLPETFIIGQNFKLLRKIAGEDEWDQPMAVRFFEDLINLN